MFSSVLGEKPVLVVLAEIQLVGRCKVFIPIGGPVGMVKRVCHEQGNFIFEGERPSPSPSSQADVAPDDGVLDILKV